MPHDSELLVVSLYKGGLDTGYVGAPISENILSGFYSGNNGPPKLYRLSAKLRPEDTRALVVLVATSKLRGFHAPSVRINSGTDDLGYVLHMRWRNGEAAYSVLPRRFWSALPEKARQKYKQIDAIAQMLLDLSGRYAIAENVRSAAKSDRAFKDYDREYERVCREVLPKWQGMLRVGSY